MCTKNGRGLLRTRCLLQKFQYLSPFLGAVLRKCHHNQFMVWMQYSEPANQCLRYQTDQPIVCLANYPQNPFPSQLT